MQSILTSTSYTRLQGILKSRYGKALEICFLNGSEWAEGSEGTSLLKDGVLHIPIHSHGHFLGVAKIHEAQTLPASSQTAIAEIVRLILEPALYRVFLEQAEAAAQMQSRYAGLQVVDATLESVMGGERSHVVLISSHNPHRVPRVALQVHEIANRWAFVNWKDIRAQMRTKKDLRDLGAMSVFVEDVLQLTEAEKNLLNDWLTFSHADSQPALILGTTMSWSDLKEQGILTGVLLHEAGFRQVQADRLPSENRSCEEALKLLLDKTSVLQS